MHPVFRQSVPAHAMVEIGETLLLRAEECYLTRISTRMIMRESVPLCLGASDVPIRISGQIEILVEGLRSAFLSRRAGLFELLAEAFAFRFEHRHFLLMAHVDEVLDVLHDIFKRI